MNKNSNLTSKDLLYIEDAFSWNYNCYIKIEHYLTIIKSKNIKKELEKINKTHEKICKKLLTLTGGCNE